MSKHTIQIELEGLITLLAQNLYADPDVFLREMLQNAHDSISKRRELAESRGETQVPAGQIRVIVDSAAHTLTIADNGSGLMESEIHEYLATIGRSGTAELRRYLAERDRAEAVDLIGQFGIGLLSAFIVAHTVVVETRAPGGPGHRWQSAGSSEYSVERLDTRERIGTDVILSVRPDMARYLNQKRLARIVRTYADFLGVPVYLFTADSETRANELRGFAPLAPDQAPVNAVHAPWHRDRQRDPGHDHDPDKAAALAYWAERFPDEVALDVLPVSETFTLETGDPDGLDDPGQGPRRVAIHGVLAITDRHVPDVNTRGTVDLYIARMFICSGNRDILPPWARFIQGVVECDQLTPNAARDNVVRERVLDAVRARLGALILAWLSRMSERDGERFTRIMRWHSYHILAMSVQPEHQGFFRQIADLVPLSSDAGPMTVPAYIAASQASADPDQPVPVYYITESGSSRQYHMLCQARGLRVFDCAEPFAERFLTTYQQTYPERIALERLDLAGSAEIFEPLADAEAGDFARLEASYHRIFPDGDVLARVERFAPTEVPAVITQARDARSRRQMQDLVENPTVPAFLRDMVTGFLEARKEPMTLHLNADNPTVARLARAPLSDHVVRLSLMTLYNNAILLSGRAISADAMRQMFSEYNQLIDLVLEQGERLRADASGGA